MYPLSGIHIDIHAIERVQRIAARWIESDYNWEKCDQHAFTTTVASNNVSNIQSYFQKHEAIKKRAYESRIREVEHSTFTPLVFSATGGMAHEVTIFFKRDCLVCYLKSGRSHMLQFWDGSGVVYLFIYLDQLYSVSEERGLPMATTSSLLLQI